MHVPKVPIVSWKKVSKLLESLGYAFIRQEGSHKRYRIDNSRDPQADGVTLPAHDPVHVKTLGRILKTIEHQTGIPKNRLVEMLNEL
jgi:predicted RNA binding protein YcfA (HicA-like mRNA interferase family)